MNQGMFKLVYSKVLNMYVPASEAVRSRGSKSAKRRVRKHANAAVFTLMVSFLHHGSVWADSPAGLVPGSQAWVNATITGATSNSLTIKQTAPRAILDWAKLNLNKGELLQFNQQGNRNWSALNRIRDLNPSFIDGMVKADGNVYFINTNGIIFGQNAQFNVGSIYAGTLDITDDLFNEGLLSKPFKPVFEGVGGFIRVEKGAEINTATGGKVVLFAENVENSGVINTPDGQTILAAGKKIYLQDSKDPAGFLVEVDGGGTATNLGKIVAERGNITIMGLAVNQSGTLTATTSVRANGSIRLLAQDSAAEIAGGVIGARNGLVTLAKGSVTEVNPEYDNKEETIVSQAFKTSKVEIEASLINIDGKISAKGGNVLATTAKTTNVASALLNSQHPTRIFLGENAEIDVSGVHALAPMSRNQLEVELFSDQLRDAPILRDGGLFKETVYVDARKGTDLFDIKPFLALKGATVSERMTKAGKVTLSTPNDLIVSKGAVINVSGGSTTYEAGAIKETNLFYNGKLVPISEAKPGVPYDTTGDLYFQKSDKWGVTRVWNLGGNDTRDWGDFSNSSSSRDLRTFIAGNFINGYVEGDDAGKVDLTVPDENVLTQNLVLAGSLLANTTVGTQQYVKQTLPKNGELLASARDLAIEASAKNLPNNFKFEDALPGSANYQSVISTDFLAQGFNDVDLSKVEKLTVNQTIALKPKGELKLNQNLASSQTNINANIFAPSSNVILAGNTTVANGVTISTAGLFTNDTPGAVGALSQPAAVDGGTITTNGGFLTIGDNVTLDASAGAWLNDAGQLQKGKAGDISFTMVSQGANTTLQSYGFDKGGILSIGFNQSLNIAGNPNASTSDVDLSADFFNLAGFSAYQLSTDGNLQIGDGRTQEIYATGSTWFISPNIKNLASGSIASVATPMLQPTETRAPVSLEFTASNVDGILTLAENTTLRTDRGGEVSLKAGKQVNVLGDITTPSGHISVAINDADPGRDYDATQAIFIGENANLSALGSSQLLPNSQANLIKAAVFNAGKIDITAQKGAVILKEGSVLDVSGTSIVNDTQTLTGFVRETLHGDAGTIKISSRDGFKLDGDLKGAASGTGRDGTLDLTMIDQPFTLDKIYPVGSRELTVTQTKQVLADGFNAGDALKNSAGVAYTETSADALTGQISAQQIAQGGFANVNLKSDFGRVNGALQDSIQLENGLNLNVAGNLKLDTPLIQVKDNGAANLNANHITLKSSNRITEIDTSKSQSNIAQYITDPIATGLGQLTAQAKQVYVDGLVVVAGVNQTAINSALDIHGKGGLIANGDIDFTARQIFPNTGVQFGVQALGAGSTFTINSNGQAAKPVLSAAGVLSVKADNIVQNGVITAPFGRIILDAKDSDPSTSNSITFTASSVTSISADSQLIPFLRTDTGGERYLDSFNPGTFKTTLLDKNIDIKSDQVSVAPNALLDLSAGGDTFAYEWIPGIGGSEDILAKPNTYAVLPNFGANYAPVDEVWAASSATVGVGESVFLTGVPGLATGTYTLLPARYALVPGAFLVEANTTSQILPNQVTPQLDGSTLTSGYRTDLSTGARDATWSTFKITDGAIFRPAAGAISKAPSQYILTSANSYFANSNNTDGLDVSRPLDAGRLAIDAAKLALDGTVKANKVAGGDGLEVDISSTNIRVVSSIGTDDGSLQLTAASINALNAESLLLGGRRDLINGVTEITTSADTVSIENNASTVIKNPEVIAAAKNTVTVKTGAAIDTGAASKTPVKAQLKANGEGALLALSSSSDISYSRTGGSASATTGDLDIQAGSELKTGKSLVLDATKSSNLDGNVSLQDGGNATFGANRILIGNAPASVSGLNINAAALAGLGQLNTLTLNSYNNVDTFGSVNFGNNQLDLTINAAGIAGHLANGETTAPANAAASTITARTFTLKNTQGAVFETPTDASGRDLAINALNVKFDGTESAAGKTTIAGFNALDIKADEVRVANNGEANFNVANTTINTGRITADTAANYSLKSNNALSITKLQNATLNTQKALGAALNIEANSLTVASNIDLASGKLALTSANDLNLAAGANVSAASAATTFYNTTEYAPAGSVTLASTSGNVNVNAGAVVDVTSQGSANAGVVKVAALNGTVNLNGTLNGAAAGTGKAGQLVVDVNALPDLTNTDKQALGFNESRQYRVRTGDVNITGTGANALKARETIVSADAGRITV
ncbi:MAG: filamentous hemagglutinin N-terminal domain-containing protein, partial [Pseudomonadota bacterium]